MGKALNLLEKLKRVKRLHENDDELAYLNVPKNVEEDEDEIENGNGEENEVEGEEAVEEVEKVMKDLLSDTGLVSLEVVEEEDGDVYVDLAFEDDKSMSLQMFVDEEGEPKVALLTDDQQENVEEIELPDSFVDEEGKLVLDLENLPKEEIKELIADKVKVTNTVEVYRRSRKTNESLSITRMKKRLVNKKRAR